VPVFHLGWFLGNGFGIKPWRGTWSGAMGSEWMKPDIYRDMAMSLERAGFDYIIMEDTCMIEDVYGGSMKTTLNHGILAPKNDPVPLIPLMTEVTKHIGVAVTLSTSLYHPFMAARTLATLDHLTEGRVGVNIVTSSSNRALQNFGYDGLASHAERYQIAHEWMDAVNQLWASWEPNAIVADQENNVYVDHTKVHVIDFEGKYFKTRGPLNTVPGPQGRPVIVQAGASADGRDFAAKHAETMLAHGTSIEQMKAFRGDMHSRMEKYGRKPSECKVLFLIDPVLGDTDAVAQDRLDELNAPHVDQDSIDRLLWSLSYTHNAFDFAKVDIDKPFPDDLPEGIGEISSLQTFVDHAKGKTIREAAATFRMHSGLEFCGSPDTVAALMGEAMDEVGGDGFLLSPTVDRRTIAEIADGLAPALRTRGLLRTGYSYPTFRENLLEF
jgi:FMN-dependent oxidoreductase (nitrilotriacetate monooxygenase family)